MAVFLLNHQISNLILSIPSGIFWGPYHNSPSSNPQFRSTIMSFSINLNWIIGLLLTGTAVLVDLLIALANAGI